MFDKLLKYFDINCSREIIEKFNVFYEMLIETNLKYNLTRITEYNEVITKHFLDSVAISSYIKENSTVIDIGTGAGFPSVPLALVRPDLQITAVDSLRKRVNFVNDVCDELKLDNLSCIHKRAEEVEEEFDYSTSRAVAKLNTLVEYHLPLLKQGGKFLAMKSLNIDDEINDASKTIEKLGGKIQNIHKYNIPTTDITRVVVEIVRL